MTPRISVVMSVYDGGRFLRASIESILTQTYGDFEFLIVDDASKDDSLEILRNFAEKDGRITIIRNEQNIGLTKSLNRALKRARGEYVARHDADDLAEPARFEAQIGVLQGHPECDVVGTGYHVIDAEGRDVNKRFLCHYADDARSALLRGENPLCHSSVMFKKSVVEKAGYYDEAYKYAQDYDLWLRLLSGGSRICNIPRRLQRLRRSGHEITATRRRQHLECVIRIRVKHLKYFGRNISYLRMLIFDCLRILLPRSARTLFGRDR
jgi:glycosyltransferase involved in cell wall biosynthesis